MTPDRLRECMAALHWGRQALAEAASVHRNTVGGWLSGRMAVPERVAAWLEQLVAYHKRHPAPPPERTRDSGAAPR